MTFKTIAFVAATLGFVASAQASFTGAYAPANWATSNTSGGNGTVSAALDGSSLSLTSSDFADGVPRAPSLLDYAIHVSQDTTFSFNWSYVTDDDSSSKDTFGYAIAGQSFQLSANNTGAYDDAQTGVFSVLVHAGQTFSFQMTSVDGIYGAATATVSSFNAAPVPEPEGYQLGLIGLACMGGMTLVRQQRRRR